jgi:hypothetical protein
MLRGVGKNERVATDACLMLFDHARHIEHSHRGIERVSSVLEDVQPCPGLKRMFGGDHAVCSHDEGSPYGILYFGGILRETRDRKQSYQQLRLPSPPLAEAAALMTGMNGEIPFSGEHASKHSTDYRYPCSRVLTGCRSTEDTSYFSAQNSAPSRSRLGNAVIKLSRARKQAV